MKTLIVHFLLSYLAGAEASEIQNQPTNDDLCTIKKLPNELILSIVESLPLYDVCQFSVTCTHFNFMQKDVPFWRSKVDDVLIEKEELVSLSNLKILIKYQEPLLCLYKHLTVDVNLPKRGRMIIHSSLPAEDITKLVDQIPHSLSFLTPKLQWHLWCAKVPGIIQVRKEKGEAPTEDLFKSWRDCLKLIAPRHPQAGLWFALLNQVIIGQSFTVEFTDSNKVTFDMELKPWVGVFNHGTLIKTSFNLAVTSNIPTAAFEYGSSLKFLYKNGFDKECPELLRKAQMEIDNWSAKAAKEMLEEIVAVKS